MVLCLIGLQISFSQTIREIFSSFPDEILMPLTTNSRMDLLDLYEANREALVRNNLGDTVRLNSFSEELIELEVGNLNLQLFLLPMINESNVIVVVKTVCASYCDSQIAFYSNSWKPLDTEAFLAPSELISFNQQPDDLQIWDVPFTQWRYVISPDGNFLQQTITASSLYNLNGAKEPNKKEMKKVFRWMGTHFSSKGSE